MNVEFPKKYKPLDDKYRYKFLYAGRGAGRSWTVARKLLIRAIQSKIRILCTREYQKSIKESVHKLLSLQINTLGLSDIFTITNDKILCKNGSEFLFFGLNRNVDEIKSTEGINVVWLEESHAVTKASWELLDPTIREPNSEIWIVMNTRFKSDFLYEYFVVNKPPPESLVIKSDYRDNPFFPDVLRKQMNHMMEQDYDNYCHVWLGELKQLADGAIFGKQIITARKDQRIRNVPIQKNCEVSTFWDLGKNDETSIWFVQRVGSEYHLIDFYENRLEEIEHYTKVIKKLDYLYGTHYLPHDADHERLGMSRNIKTQLNDGGVRPTKIVPRIAHKSTAIELTRELFPRMYFHAGEDERGRRVEKGIEHLSLYRYDFNDKNNVFNMIPVHDAHSNASDALQTLAQSNFEVSGNDWDTPING